jgi:hypothetical protein
MVTGNHRPEWLLVLPLRVLRGEQADAVERETPPACRRSEEFDPYQLRSA